jgi:serine/threonine protein kinase/Tfp pilus assembly protein PilF
MNGKTIAHYRVVSKIGAGGMGEVFLAEDTRLHRYVALKLLPEEFVGDRERISRFNQEARAASALSHPNIVTIFEVGEVEGRHFIATEYIDGDTLRQRIEGRPMTLTDVLDVAIGVASALVAAHEVGIIHRDIKPENVMIRRDGIIKVLDFGLAKLTEPMPIRSGRVTSRLTTDPGMVMGTVHYMSPEQLRGAEIDHRADVFSLGEVIYEMLSGHAPFDGATSSDVIAAILDREPAPLSRYLRDVPAELERIVYKALRKDRLERYQSARDLLIDLRSLKQEMEFAARQERISGPVARGEDRDSQPFSRRTSGTRRVSGGSYVMEEIRANRDVVIGALVMVVIVIFAFVYFSRSQPAYESLAVLPFVNSSGDPNAEYLSDGLTESIIHRVSQLPKLQVMALSSVFRFKGQQIDPQKVGRELNVAAVLTGRVLQRGDTLIVQADLVDVERGTLLWGEQYNRRLSDILVIQSDIAQEITSKLRLRLTGEELARLTKTHVNDEEAYRLYLKGRYYWNKRTTDGLRRGIEYFNRAIERAPDYALAHAGLADCYNLLPVYSLTPPAEAFPKAKEAAERALQLDSTLAEAFTSRAWAEFNYDWEWKAAERDFHRALELNANYATGYHWFSLYLSAMGRHDQSIEMIHRAQELDPLSLAINVAVGTSYYLAGRYDDAAEQFRRALELDPSFRRASFELARVYEIKGMHEEAVRQLEGLQKFGNPATPQSLARAYILAGREAEGEKLLQELIERSATTYVNPYDIAAIYAAKNDKENVFLWLEKAHDEHVSRLVYLRVEPMFRQFRNEPEFADLLRRVGL